MLSPAECAALVRNDFYAFIQCCLYELNPHTPFPENWHIELIAAKLDACRGGEWTRFDHQCAAGQSQIAGGLGWFTRAFPAGVQ